ncbi:hypothetical protein [uncultured Flavobacterium sp.]|uniref:hypothetical protein n=1 Tax=uncultured Flavobacterium sp. TaxID=165435 RepID=UPI0025D30BCB|nr:hypothetical protein [uncultured Flavobacterium sp.]
MKTPLLSILFITLAFTACKNKHEDTIVHTEKSKKIDTLWRGDFKVFFDKFATDTIFQKNHIQFPLKEVYTDFPNENTQNIVTRYKDKDKYKYLYLTTDTPELNKKLEYEYQKTTVKTEKIADTIIHTKRSGAIMIKYKFTPNNNNSWNLIEARDLSI